MQGRRRSENGAFAAFAAWCRDHHHCVMMSVCTGETLQAYARVQLCKLARSCHCMNLTHCDTPGGVTSFVNKQNEAMQFFDRVPDVPLMQLGKGACMFVWACIAFVSAAWCLLPSLLLPACLFTSNLTIALAHFHSRLCTFSPPLSPSGFHFLSSSLY